MRIPNWMFTGALILSLVACGGNDPAVTVTPAPAAAAAATATATAVAPATPATQANGTPAVLPSEVIEIISTEQFDAEIAKPRPDAVVIADFHAEWCLPCRKLGPELVTIAQANPGKFFVLRIDFDQHPKLAERFQVENLPLLVKFKDGKESARMVGHEKDKAKFSAWLGME